MENEKDERKTILLLESKLAHEKLQNVTHDETKAQLRRQVEVLQSDRRRMEEALAALSADLKLR